MYSSKKIELSQEEAATILKKFLPEKWNGIEPSTLSVTRVAEGFVNTVNIVQVIGDDTSRVIIRHTGGNQFSEQVNELNPGERTACDELFVMQEMSRTKYGPKLIGVFNGGVVMEYVDSHTMTTAEAKDHKITDDLAKCYAHYHQMELPFNRVAGKSIRGLQEKITESDLETMKESQSIKDFLSPEQITFLMEFKWDEEYDWVMKLIKAADLKMAFCQNDSNLANILVRNHPLEGQLKVVPIDYELAGYSYRGCDLARFIALSPLDLKDKQNIRMNEAFFTRDDIKGFVKTYMEEFNNTAPARLKDPERDTVEHMLRETEMGMAIIGLEACIGITKKINMFQGPNAQFVMMIPCFLKMFMDTKKQLVQLYPEVK